MARFVIDNNPSDVPEPQINNGVKYAETNKDTKLLLIFERDIPQMKQELSNLKETINDIKTDIEKNNIFQVSTQKDVEAINKKMEEYSQSRDKHLGITNDTAQKVEVLNSKVDNIISIVSEKKTEGPWYSDFRNILILILVAGMMTIAGVKAAEQLIPNINSLTSESSNATTNTEQNVN